MDEQLTLCLLMLVLRTGLLRHLRNLHQDLQLGDVGSSQYRGGPGPLAASSSSFRRMETCRADCCAVLLVSTALVYI